MTTPRESVQAPAAWALPKRLRIRDDFGIGLSAIVDDEGLSLETSSNTGRYLGGEFREAVRARIVETYNACAGLADPARDVPALLAALKRIAESEPRPLKGGAYPAHEIESMQRTARAALAKVARA